MLFIFPQNFVWVGAIIKKSYKNIGVQSYLQLTLHRGTQTLMNNITPKINVKGTDMKCASLRKSKSGNETKTGPSSYMRSKNS